MVRFKPFFLLGVALVGSAVYAALSLVCWVFSELKRGVRFAVNKVAGEEIIV